MVYDSANGNCPEYLTDIFILAQKIHNYGTRHENHGLFPSHTNLVAGQRTFQYRGCHLWNSLPQQIQCATSSQNFKKACSNTPLNKIKSFRSSLKLIQKYFVKYYKYVDYWTRLFERSDLLSERIPCINTFKWNEWWNEWLVNRFCNLGELFSGPFVFLLQMTRRKFTPVGEGGSGL